MMKLYSAPLSLFARKVEIALAEKGLVEGRDYAREMVPFTQKSGYQPKHPTVLEVNPKGQVPVLIDGDLRLYDSTLILEYLDDKFPSPPLLPPISKSGGAEARARARQQELYADEILFPMMRKLGYRTGPLPADPTERAALEKTGQEAEAAIAREFAALDAQLAGRDFLWGDISLADIGLFMTMLYIRRMHGPQLDPFPALAGWWRRLMARPGFARAADEIAAADRAMTPALAQYAAMRGK
ncbi:MAG TPA: glutathione S-transferase family protein [Dongiaceae bacterium]|nr:glutathione S-transferase family protein [Dongiaceae bacterium]